LEFRRVLFRSVVASARIAPERRLQELIDIQRDLARAHTADDHLPIALTEEQSVDDCGVHVLLGLKKIRRLGNRVAVEMTQVADTGNRPAAYDDAIRERNADHFHCAA